MSSEMVQKELSVGDGRDEKDEEKEIWRRRCFSDREEEEEEEISSIFHRLSIWENVPVHYFSL